MQQIEQLSTRKRKTKGLISLCISIVWTVPLLLVYNKTGPEGITKLSCSTHKIAKFQLLVKQKYQQIRKFPALRLSGVVFIMLINVKMPTIVGILTFMSRKKFVFS